MNQNNQLRYTHKHKITLQGNCLFCGLKLIYFSKYNKPMFPLDTIPNF